MSRTESTSVRIRRDTLARLNSRKEDGETHDDLVCRLLNGFEANTDESNE